MAKERKETEGLWSLIEKNKEDFIGYKGITESNEKSLKELILKAEMDKQNLNEIHRDIEKISKESKETFKTTEEKIKEINEKVKLNNLKIASGEALAEMIEKRFQMWEQKLKDRESVVQTAFKEARQRKIL